jgi:Na+/H+ antiporter NhaA
MPVRRFIATESGSAGLLLFATLAALVWANSPWSASCARSGAASSRSGWPTTS